ncbi:MAG: flagellar protein FlgN [Planctomycetes bacterium]|nr:flagellar protein FlgN [Planctomycetota bacterium]
MDTMTLKRLFDLIDRQREAHKELRTALLDQQTALRRFDTRRLEQLGRRCDALGERIAELEQARRNLTGLNVRLSELAATLGEPDRSRLTAAAMGLRQLAADVASINRINASAVHNMLNHFHQVYQMIASAGRTTGYGASGQADKATGAFLVDAVA